ncbi:MAG TPA: aldo/keto reductase [Verrucomicrobiae bacterium]|nr:aldo/keto reductase [Verrucomicrobiae bacterium]
MNYRPLGVTGIKVSEIGFGSWGLGGEAYGPTDDAVSEQALNTAFDEGINFYDTADLYGAGHSEELIGRIFKGRRDKVVIATKGGTLPHTGFHMPQDFSPRHLRQALENSLRRLQTDYVDLYQLHSPSVEALSNGAAIATLEKLRDAGKIRSFGVSARSPRDAMELLWQFQLDVVQVNYNLIDQRAHDDGLLALARKKSAGIIARTPLCFGYLTGKMSGTETLARRDHRANWPVEQLRRWAESPGLFAPLYTARRITPAQFALRFCLQPSVVATTIPGLITPEQVLENVKAVNLPPITPEEMEIIRDLYHTHTFYDPGIKVAATQAELSRLAKAA